MTYLEPQDALPGMEQMPQEMAQAAAETLALNLTAEFQQPLRSISAVTGRMEQQAPLFANTEANPQGRLF